MCSHDSQTNHSLRHRTLAPAAWNQGKLEILRIDQLFYAFKASRRCTTVQVIKKEAQISSQYHTCRNTSRRSQYRLRKRQSQILRHILILFLYYAIFCNFVAYPPIMAKLTVGFVSRCYYPSFRKPIILTDFRVFHTYINLMIIKFYKHSQ